MVSQKLLASGALLLEGVVNWSIDLDDKPRLGTIKVDDETPDRVLASELKPSATLITKRLPDDILRCSGHCSVFPDNRLETGPQTRIWPESPIL